MVHCLILDKPLIRVEGSLVSWLSTVGDVAPTYATWRSKPTKPT